MNRQVRDESACERQKIPYRFSYENYTGEELVRYFFVKNPRAWLNVEDIQACLEKHGKELKMSYLYNILSKLRSLGFIKSRRSSFAEYHLKDLGCEKHPVGVSSLVPRVWRLDFFDYLGTLCWEDVRRVHDIRFWTPVDNCDFVGGDWIWKDGQGMFLRRELVDGKYRFTFQTYVKAKSLVVSVACSNRPVAVDVEGLTHLYSVLCGVRAEYLNSSSVPHVDEWIVKQWHYGRDSMNSVSGFSFELSFHDWFGNLIRIYTRHGVDGKVRLERVENPNILVSKLLDGLE